MATVAELEKALLEAKREEALCNFLENPKSSGAAMYIRDDKIIRIIIPNPLGKKDRPWDLGYVYEVKLAVTNKHFADTGTKTSFTSYPSALSFLNGKDEEYLDDLAAKHNWVLEKRQDVRKFDWGD
jgi:hypothetical protein